MDNNNKVMRKLKLQVEMSIDGCIAGPNNEMDWLISDDDVIRYIYYMAESVDTIIIGRKMVDEFILYWTEVANKSNDSWNSFAKKNDRDSKDCFYENTNQVKLDKYRNCKR